MTAGEPTRVVVALAQPDAVVVPFCAALAAEFPAIELTRVRRRDEIEPHIATADIIMTFGATMTDALFRRARRLRWVQVLGTGVDHIVDAPSLGRGTIVTNIRGVHGPGVAEAAIAGMLALARQVPRAVRAQDRHAWERFSIRLLDGGTAAIFGVGTIAGVLAPRLQALGMRVVGISGAPRPVAGFAEMHHRNALLTAVGGCDFLVLLTPHGPATHRIINEAVFSAMRPGAFLVNLARGDVVDEGAMLAALQSGHLAGAALDVFSVEPLPPDHPLWAMENVVITAHSAGFHDGYFAAALPLVRENLRRFLAGETAHMLNRVRRDRAPDA